MPALNIPIPQLGAKSSGAGSARVKGGFLTEVHPTHEGEPLPPIVVQFDPTVAQVYAVHRIHIALHGFIGEHEVEKQTIEEVELKQFSTEAEAQAFVAGKEGFTLLDKTITPISAHNPFEEVTATAFAEQYAPEKKRAEIHTSKVVERSVLPGQLEVTARLIGPEGAVWAETFPIPVTAMQTALGAGNYQGVGAVDLYSDLVNPLVVYSSQQYTLRFYVRVPTGVETTPTLGLNFDGTTFPPSEDVAQFFYSSEARYGSG